MRMGKWEELAYKVAETIDRERSHISLIIRKNQLLAIGTNNWKTHPKMFKFGYMYPYLHSELDAYRKIKVPTDKLVLLNFRISKVGKLGMSMPCKYCLPWCSQVFDRIIFTDKTGGYSDV